MFRLVRSLFFLGQSNICRRNGSNLSGGEVNVASVFPTLATVVCLARGFLLPRAVLFHSFWSFVLLTSRRGSFFLSISFLAVAFLP